MPDWFKYIAGEDFESFVQTPNLEQVVDSVLKRAAAGELLGLGHSLQHGHVEISQAEREGQMHIIGAPGEGKSKFLEYLIHKDIDRLVADQDKPREEWEGCGLCLIDPSAGADTAYKVLRYCALKSFKKVFLVDAGKKYQFRKIAAINPFDCPESYSSRLESDLNGALRVAFSAKEPGKQAYIESYLPAIFSVIYEFGGTLADTFYFTSPPRVNLENDLKRSQMLDKALDSKNVIVRNNSLELTEVYRTPQNFSKEIGSTVRRLKAFFRGQDDMRSIFGHREGADFDKLISDGWVILVNASDERLDTIPSRLLAATIINRLISAKERLWHSGNTRPYYLYVDEVSRFATDTISDVLELKRKTGMRVVLAHQNASQIRDKDIRDCIKKTTKIKAAFWVPDVDDRKENMRMLGYPDDSDIWEALSVQPARQMAIKINKNEPVLARVYDTPDIPDEALPKPFVEFIREILTSNDVVKYYSSSEIEADYDARYKLSSSDFESARRGKASNGSKPRKNSVPKGGGKKSIPKGDEAAKNDGKREAYKF